MRTQYSRYARQLIYPGIGEEGQHRLVKAKVIIIGCGANGTNIANSLARAGVGHLRLIDRDFIELNNLQRQSLFDEQDFRENLPKAIAAERKLRLINSEIDIEGIVSDVNSENIEELIAGAHLVMDGTDNFEVRFIINDACVKLNIPWIYTGAVSSYGMSQTIIPHRTACFRCIYQEPPQPGTFATCDTVGVLGPLVSAIASISAAEAIKLMVGSEKFNQGIIHFDVWENSYEKFESGGPRPDCPACGLGQYEFLEAERGSTSISLCGRNAVQIRVSGENSIDLRAIAARITGKAKITAINDYLLRFAVDRYELTLFPDARAIIKGASDESVARGLYSKYIGL